MDLPPNHLVYKPIVSTKYAILFSDGYTDCYAYPRYWNHITWFYELLLLNGYDPNNIYSLYNDGVGDNSDVPVDGPGTSEAMNQPFTYLSSEMGRTDALFV